VYPLETTTRCCGKSTYRSGPRFCATIAGSARGVRFDPYISFKEVDVRLLGNPRRCIASRRTSDRPNRRDLNRARASPRPAARRRR
jgi:hypothetical protein